MLSQSVRLQVPSPMPLLKRQVCNPQGFILGNVGSEQEGAGTIARAGSEQRHNLLMGKNNTPSSLCKLALSSSLTMLLGARPPKLWACEEHSVLGLVSVPSAQMECSGVELLCSCSILYLRGNILKGLRHFHGPKCILDTDILNVRSNEDEK